MNECAKNVRAVACFIDSQLGSELAPKNLLGTINESCLVDILSSNKVAFAFEQRITNNNSSKEIFNDLPQLRDFFYNLNNKREKDSVAFSQIRDKLSEDSIDFLLIKSDGSFPYESDNVDVLIRPAMLSRVSTILSEAGYSEVQEVRERSKYLFRDMSSYDVLPLHVHTRVEWEGTQFVDSADLWLRCRESSEEGGFCIPSPEDCILITIAHLFFENHKIKLADLYKISNAIENNKIDWNYILDHVRRLHWDDAFSLAILLSNSVYKYLYGRNMIKQSVLSKIEDTKPSYVGLFQTILKPNSSDIIPLAIPYNFVGLFFVRRVICDSSLSLAKRFKHLEWNASNVLRERLARMSDLSYS